MKITTKPLIPLITEHKKQSVALRETYVIKTCSLLETRLMFMINYFFILVVGFCFSSHSNNKKPTIMFIL